MDVVRRVSLLATTGLLGLAILLGSLPARPARPALSANAAAHMRLASEYFDSTIVLARNARPRGARGDALTVALGYLERERLGFGSPFKLVDDALHDPRIDPWISARVTWGLLARLRRGESYVVDPAALDGIGPWSPDGHGATGAAHVAWIERTVAAMGDPRVGELAVRLAYEIAAANGSLSPAAVPLATQTAALVRDRHLAEDDLRDLFAEASARQVGVMTLLGDWRAARRFRVEQPALIPLTSEQRTIAMNAVPALVQQLDALDRSAVATGGARADRSLLGEKFGERLGVLAAEQPPLAQLAVPLRARRMFGGAADVANDEALAAALSRTNPVSDSTLREVARTQLAGAVALRTLNQATPWFAGDGGPDASDLMSEFGLGGVTFAHGVRASWRPYYLRELESSLRDLSDVFPALSFSGLAVAFGNTELPDSALAMHDPRTRTVRLTIATSGGTLAHELAHDLDWQTGRRMFATAGGYSTDRAVREQRGALAASVRGLSVTRRADRPTELFARGTDWFVASALALSGRSNGFLTAVQDASLPGYAAGAPTAIGAAGAESLTSAIDQMTFVADSVRAAFQSRWGDARSIDPAILVHRVVTAPVSFRGAWSKPAALPPPRSLLCAASDTPGAVAREAVAREAVARERLVNLAIAARAHGVAIRRARYRRSMMRDTWANALTATPPWDPAAAERLESTLRMSIETEIRSVSGMQGIVPAVPAPFTGCW